MLTPESLVELLVKSRFYVWENHYKATPVWMIFESATELSKKGRISHGPYATLQEANDELHLLQGAFRILSTFNIEFRDVDTKARTSTPGEPVQDVPVQKPKSVRAVRKTKKPVQRLAKGGNRTPKKVLGKSKKLPATNDGRRTDRSEDHAALGESSQQPVEETLPESRNGSPGPEETTGSNYDPF